METSWHALVANIAFCAGINLANLTFYPFVDVQQVPT